jgi:hypothetical protein
MFDGCQPSSDDVDVSVPSPKSFSPKLTSMLGLGKLRSGMGLAVRRVGSWRCERHRLMNRETTCMLGFLDRTCGRNRPTKMFLTRSTYRSELSNVASKMYVQDVMIECSITREREQSERARERERERDSERDSARDSERDSEREREREREGDAQRGRERQREAARETEKGKEQQPP